MVTNIIFTWWNNLGFFWQFCIVWFIFGIVVWVVEIIHSCAYWEKHEQKELDPWVIEEMERKKEEELKNKNKANVS